MKNKTKVTSIDDLVAAMHLSSSSSLSSFCFRRDYRTQICILGEIHATQMFSILNNQHCDFIKFRRMWANILKTHYFDTNSNFLVLSVNVGHGTAKKRTPYYRSPSVQLWVTLPFSRKSYYYLFVFFVRCF